MLQSMGLPGVRNYLVTEHLTSLAHHCPQSMTQCTTPLDTQSQNEVLNQTVFSTNGTPLQYWCQENPMDGGA